MSAYVFILSDYDEDGAEHVTATTNRLLLEEMIDQNWPDCSVYPGSDRAERHRIFIETAKAKLAEALQKPDEEHVAFCREHGGIHLHDGWGGIELHVVRLV